MYYFFAIYFIFCLFIYSKINKTVGLFFLFFCVSLIYIARGDSVGTDTANYLDIFNNSKYFFDVNLGIEPLFVYLNYLVFIVGGGASSLFFVFISIWFFCWIKSINILVDENKDVALLILFFAMPFVHMFNITRQAIATAICVLAFSFLINDKKRLFFFLSVVAFFIHYSALVFIIISLIIFFYRRPIIYLVSSFIISFLFFGYFVEFFLAGSHRYSGYNASDNINIGEVSGVFLIIICSFKLIVFYFLYYYKFKYDKNFCYFLSFYSVGYSILLAMKLLGAQDEGPVRLSFYFLVFEVFLFPYLFYILKKYNQIILLKFILFSFFIFLFIFTIIGGAGGLYPYVFNWRFFA